MPERKSASIHKPSTLVRVEGSGMEADDAGA